MTTSTTRPNHSAAPDNGSVDAIIVGAGFAGMYMLHRLRLQGLTARVFEAGSGVGGTWYWNRYPGARCDTESIEYSYSFDEEIQQKWEWSERYPTQPEILRYANWVADRLDLKRDIEFNTRVISATFREDGPSWLIQTDTGLEIRARYCIMASGCLSSAQVPEIPGLESFEGDWYHTGNWPHGGVDFTGQRVGIIGTGSSAIQSIPIIARQADHLYVFQRTPNYSVPAHNGPLDAEYLHWVKKNYSALREQARNTRRGYIEDVSSQDALELTEDERQAEFERRWQTGGLGYMSSFTNLLYSEPANESAAEFVRQKIREIVRDSDTAELLVPRDYPIGTKRLCVDSHYFETYNRENVTLVDLKAAPIERITSGGVRTADREYGLDNIVLATGFDAMTGTLNRVDISGRQGQLLREKWRDGPSTYLGLAVAGFPNMFLVTGPGSPSVLSNMMLSIEQHVEWISNCIEYLGDQGIELIEATPESETEWTNHVNEVAAGMLFSKGNSWWKGANVPGKPVVFMPYAGGVDRYRRTCDEVASDDYRGFELRAASARIARG